MSSKFISIDQRDLGHQLGKLRDKLAALNSVEVDRAMASALNKTSLKLRTDVLKKSAPLLAVKQKLLRPKVTIKKATSRQLEANLRVNTSGISLINLGAKQTDWGVAAGPYVVQGGFIATVTNTPKFSSKGRSSPNQKAIGKTFVFKRKGASRYPLQSVKVEIKNVVTAQTKNAVNTTVRNDIRRLLIQEYKFRILRKAGIAK